VALLEPGILQALERLSIATRGRMIGFFAGDHRSRRFGSSIDFADYREYRPGDDFRRIDPAVSARLDRLFLRLFEAEEDLPVRVIVDASASMAFGTPPKARLAAQVAAAFAHVALVQNDRVRLYAASDGGAQTSRWFRGKADSTDAMRWLAERGSHGGPGMREAVRGIREEGRPGILVAISDLLEPGWEETIRRFAPPGEAAVVHLLAPEELTPGFEGDITLVDAETGDEVAVSATADLLTEYERRLDAWMASVRSACTSRGIAFASARSDADVKDLFLRSFRREQVLR
jgi:uncharacterized protein (DUF58 family)